jgi:hypothetical protein
MQHFFSRIFKVYGCFERNLEKKAFYLYTKKLLRSINMNKNGFSNFTPKVKLKTINTHKSVVEDVTRKEFKRKRISRIPQGSKPRT